MQPFLIQLLNGVQLSMLVFLLAVGLTLIFGLMNILNLAHGAFFTMGAYFGLVVANKTGSFWLALLIGPLLPFAAGFVLQFFVLQPLAQRGRSTHLDLALLTFGLLFATAGAVEYIYGSAFHSIVTPDLLKGRVALLGIEYPIYRLFITAVGIAIAIALVLVIDRTLVGATLRAGVDNREMVTALGININVLFALVFGFGSALAGFAGVVSAPVMSIYSSMGIGIVVTTFVVVVVGGLGNLKGSFYASLIVGMTDTFAQAYLPEAELFAIYILLIAVMIFRPQGLFGAVGRVA
ncbi:MULTISPECIES: branched-chain amino acid ABC transporter permease [unclassified Bradyrhizobium]|uniref:branched-chain amino acid ABC transporter permease n=2 Tax=Bradyrhizobium TaxID=374 RepID=UPI001FF32458|nr:MULTISPECIES: branched-chain amino acid ABC transporter permease [unclassified Bradyrhizobium]MCJ9701940.1 branched-chain amino acid ABC transporter permease [Bradyrhizobium sp. SHOUNA76]MCJ9731130.1 branched-chain amino acid ABC transporter permease [Bradyrhizobium sp. PRIMUS42]UPK24648.1 branched-chain amino acid ABC transporter permease [Bradyrhizobium sp. 195]